MEYEARVMQQETQIMELKDRIAAMGKELEVAKQTKVQDNKGNKEEQLVREHQGSEERQRLRGSINLVMVEQQRVEQRKKNIWVSRIEEEDKDGHETSLVDKIQEKIKQEFKIVIKVTEAFRVGKREEGRNRVVIAKCIDEVTKCEAIKTSRICRGSTLMVTKDRTQMEWEKFKHH